MTNTETDNKPKLKVYSKFKVIGTFIFLYTIQGLFFGLNNSILMIFNEKSSNNSNLFYLTLTSSPFYLKFLIAPIMDFYYSNKIGKRMSWVLPTGCLLLVAYIYLSMNIEVWIEDLDIWRTSVSLFMVCALCAVQDVAIDGMVVDILNEEDYDTGAVTQSIGQVIGPFIGANVYLLLSSGDWCKTHLNTDGPLLNIVSFTRYLGFYSLFATFAAFLLLKEEKHKHKVKISTKKLMSLIPKIIIQKNMKWQILITPIFETFHNFIGGNLLIRLQNIGFSKEQLSQFDSYFILFDLIATFVYAKMRIGKNLWKYYKLGNTISFFSNLCMGLATIFIVAEGTGLKLILCVYVLHRMLSYVSGLQFMAKFVSFQMIADSKVGATSMTVLNSVSNFFMISTKNASMKLISGYGFSPVFTVISACTAVSIFGFREKYIDMLKNKKKEDYAIEFNDEQKEKKEK